MPQTARMRRNKVSCTVYACCDGDIEAVVRQVLLSVLSNNLLCNPPIRALYPQLQLLSTRSIDIRYHLD